MQISENFVPYAVENFGQLPDDAGLTIDETATILGTGKSTIWNWAKIGRIRLRRIGRTTRVPVGEIRRLMARS